TQALWIADGYGFALAGLLITAGNVGDRIGRKLGAASVRREGQDTAMRPRSGRSADEVPTPTE
ncbi:hypothetical protein AB0878_48025, partial [Amycolatopsis sp. NPDC047767]|uniref:hypothetical protein n=1 Tax=Amycolatopsis sp. NPDC047767 TaxID=3156765 RepID=UPI00345425D2